jgi:hypothetical protein
MISIEVLDEVLASGSFSIVSRDSLATLILSLREEYHPLLRGIEVRFLSAAGSAILIEHLIFLNGSGTDRGESLNPPKTC